MKLARALMIFSDINNPGFSDEEKAMAIYTVMNMATHNSVSKDKMLSVIKWLWNTAFEIEEGQHDRN